MNSAERLLIIDDEPAMRHLLRTILEEEGYLVEEAADGQLGLDCLGKHHFDLILCDIRMPNLDGMGFIGQALALNPALTIIMMSAYGSLETALKCMKHGAYDYISKPFRPDEIVLTLKKARERLKLQHENVQLRQELRRGRPATTIISNSPIMQQILTKVDTLAQVRSPVLICGETGTGKELIARALHENSPRKTQPFIAINCSAIAANLIESELFGHRKGAFTGADKSHPGLFAAADGGTVFLDEIGELPLEMQPKLLRVLQEEEVRPVGETKPRRIDVRIVAATARNLKQDVTDNRFREDLYYRLAVVELNIPALRSRQEDIPTLCNHFLQRIAQREQRSVPTVTQEVIATLQQYPWSGNVRELENVMEKIMIFQHSNQIECSDLPFELSSTPAKTSNATPPHNLSLKQAIAAIEQQYIHTALQQTGGNRVQAAKILEISLRSLHYKIKEYNLT
ncbi:MAG: sigma-54 dependent transcriptional regulator [Thermodesulfobacteriota bacterium]|nr:sigma-54 dependent transcriptional regulator [Thermodesulfobacteriota bacterium]